MPKDTLYAYAVARIRAIEKKLLDKTGIDRMVDAKSPEESLKMIVEAGYGNPSGDSLQAQDYEKLLKEEQKKVCGLIKEIAPEPEIFDLFLHRHDYHNLKVILKSEFLGQDNDEIFIDFGTISVNKLKMMVRDRNFSEMPEIMRAAVEECIDTFNRTGDSQSIDLIMDRASFEHMKEVAKKSCYDFLIELVKIMADIANIKIFLRVKKLGKSWDFLQKVLLPGGSIDSKAFIENLDAPIDNFINMLFYKPYGKLAEGLESFKASGSMTKFEKLSDNFIISYARKSIYKPLGIEPLVGYVIAKENEIKNIRIIMVGKINNIPNDIIRERLRESYV